MLSCTKTEWILKLRFLGVHIEHKGEEIKMIQKGLTTQIIDALGVQNGKLQDTPAVAPLPLDKDGDPPNGTCNCASVIGMLQHLQAHSQPDITVAVSQGAHFVHSPKQSHEEALEHIGMCLRKTEDKGLVFQPSENIKINCCMDTDFSGLWGCEDPKNPTVAKNRTGFIIAISNCPVIWSSKSQSSVALSTVEAQCNALSSAMRDLLPF